MKEKQNEAGRKRIKSSVLSSWAPLGIVCSLLFHFLKLSAKTFINYWVLGGEKKENLFAFSCFHIGQYWAHRYKHPTFHMAYVWDPLQIPIPQVQQGELRAGGGGVEGMKGTIGLHSRESSCFTCG